MGSIAQLGQEFGQYVIQLTSELLNKAGQSTSLGKRTWSHWLPPALSLPHSTHFLNSHAPLDIRGRPVNKSKTSIGHLLS